MSGKIILAGITGCLVIVSLLFNQDTTSLSAAQACKDIQVVFARGSGQGLNDDDAAAFFSKIKERLPEQLSFREYDLGTSEYRSYQYPAIDIGDFFVKIRAKISAGYSYEYGDSVKEGVGELKHYLNQQAQACPETQYILGGFSQGAQVIGQSLNHLSEEIRDKIVFAALFGDPKLHLPEGKGLFPPACSGRDLSPWRRVVEVCTTSAGALEERSPYVPDDMQDKVGTWCLSQDYICGSTNLPWEVSGHSKYREPGSSIEQAAQEIAQKLKTTFTYQSHKGTIKTAPRPQQKPSTKDVSILFIVDHTINMQSDYPTYFLPKMRQLAQSLGPETQIGFDGYTGCWRDDDSDKEIPSVLLQYIFKTYQQWQAQDKERPNWLSVDMLADQIGLPYYSIEPGCDLSWELGIHAWRGINNIAQSYRWVSKQYIWTEDKTRRIIVPITNTPYYPNDTPFNGNNGLFTQTITNQPTVSIYPLVPDEIRRTFKSLEELGEAQVHLIDDEKIAEEILKTIKNPQLEARLSTTQYKIAPNTDIILDATPSLVHDDTVAKYEWDFESDGVIDETTTTPSVAHTYSMPAHSVASVKITSASGITATASAEIEIVTPSDNSLRPAPPSNLRLQQLPANEVKLTWDASDDLADKWLIFVNDLPAGYVEKDQHSIDITDVRSDEVTRFAVQAFSSDALASEKAGTTPPSQKQIPQSTQAPTTTLIEKTPLTSSIKLPNTLSEILGTTASVSKPHVANSHSTQTHNNPITIVYIIGGIVLVFASISIRAIYIRHHRT